MTLYFLSPVPAALRLNGQYVGVIDCFERKVEIQGDVFAEITPSDGGLPLCFIIDADFFRSPPASADVYLIGDDALIKLRAYRSSDAALRVIAQARTEECLFTLYSQGGLFVSCDGRDFSITELDRSFCEARFERQSVGGVSVMCLFAEGALAIFTESGKLVFRNAVKSYSCGDMLGVTIEFPTCADCEGECSFSFDGESFTLVSGTTRERREVRNELLHFAFFESVLVRGDSARYLSDELAPEAGKLSAYLGEFVDVLVPPQKFYAARNERRAAGLVYPLGRNLFRVKFYAADVEGGKVVNIREIPYP